MIGYVCGLVSGAACTLLLDLPKLTWRGRLLLWSVMIGSPFVGYLLSK